MMYLGIAVFIVALAFVGWKLTARGAYESAEYTVLKSDGAFELREYPDLMMATTNMKFQNQGGDGSFGRLFQYISGSNEEKQKVAMTTPVFMEPETQDSQGQMGFVIPKKVASGNIPQPANGKVELTKRLGGQFAVIRFSGRLNPEIIEQQQSKLRGWIDGQDLAADGEAEVAGYDPPWTPGPLRRNELLIRLKIGE